MPECRLGRGSGMLRTCQTVHILYIRIDVMPLSRLSLGFDPVMRPLGVSWHHYCLDRSRRALVRTYFCAALVSSMAFQDSLTSTFFLFGSVLTAVCGVGRL